MTQTFQPDQKFLNRRITPDDFLLNEAKQPPYSGLVFKAYREFLKHLRYLRLDKSINLNNPQTVIEYIADKPKASRRYFEQAMGWLYEGRRAATFNINSGQHQRDRIGDDILIPRDYREDYESDRLVENPEIPGVFTDPQDFPDTPIFSYLRYIQFKQQLNTNHSKESQGLRLFELIHAFNHLLDTHSSLEVRGNNSAHCLSDLLFVNLKRSFSKSEEDLIRLLMIQTMREKFTRNIQHVQVELGKIEQDPSYNEERLYKSNPFAVAINVETKASPMRRLDSHLTKIAEFLFVFDMVNCLLKKPLDLTTFKADFVGLVTEVNEKLRSLEVKGVLFHFDPFVLCLAFNLFQRDSSHSEQYSIPEVNQMSEYLSELSGENLYYEMINEAKKIYEDHTSKVDAGESEQSRLVTNEGLDKARNFLMGDGNPKEGLMYKYLTDKSRK